MKRQNGFTLVELAIVLMIIGLLIGGILRGKEMMKNAQVTSTIQQVKSYQGAYHTFFDAYAGMPGDLALAMNRVPGCTSANNCLNGNGNGFLDNASGYGQYNDAPWQNVVPALTSENSQFWKHLALAHLISGIDPSAGTPAWGKSHPASKTGNGGFFVRYTIGDPGVLKITGTIFLLRQPIDGTEKCGGDSNTQSDCSVSPRQAAQIDRKMDDGIALKGNVWSISDNWQNGCGVVNTGIDGPNGYDETKETPACEIMFMLQ